MIAGGYTLMSLGLCTALAWWVYTKFDTLNREVDRLTRANAKSQAYIDQRDADGWQRPKIQRKSRDLDMTRQMVIPEELRKRRRDG